jgi:hypothetical protein
MQHSQLLTVPSSAAKLTRETVVSLNGGMNAAVRFWFVRGTPRGQQTVPWVPLTREHMRPNLSLNPDASPAALRAVRSAPVIDCCKSNVLF